MFEQSRMYRKITSLQSKIEAQIAKKMLITKTAYNLTADKVGRKKKSAINDSHGIIMWP